MWWDTTSTGSTPVSVDPHRLRLVSMSRSRPTKSDGPEEKPFYPYVCKRSLPTMSFTPAHPW